MLKDRVGGGDAPRWAFESAPARGAGAWGRRRRPPLHPFEGIFITWLKEAALEQKRHSPGKSLPALAEIHAVEALLRPRVPPATAKELPRYAPQISVLSTFKEISSSSEILVGTHGVVAERGKRWGVVLPQDAEGLPWDGERLLGQACLRAGLPEESWKTPGSVRLRRFTAETF